MYKKLTCTVFLLFFIFLSKNSYGFLVNEIVGSVDNIPITLNELYFFNNFNRINNLKYNKFNHRFSKSSLKKSLNVYINRLLILRQEKKFGAVKISERQIDAYIKGFEKKFKMLHKNMLFSVFLKTYGFNKIMFVDYVKNILLEKEFIHERLHFFLYSFEKSISTPSSTKKIQSRELLSRLKDWVNRLRRRANIEINDNY